MCKGIFITGTDTDVGKTIVTAGLLSFIRKNNINAIPVKPIQTGCIKNNDEYIVPDLECSLNLSGMKIINTEKKTLSSYCYEPACSPHLAAELSNNYPEIEKIKNNITSLSKNYECILVEGAGGIMVPINNAEMMLDLIKTLSFPVVLVARAGLGTINHTLLSVETLRKNGVNVIGVFINNVIQGTEDDTFIRENNISAIEKYGNVKVLGILEYLKEIKRNDFSKIFEESLLDKKYILEFIKNGEY
jgi:dethiobiotin synthase